MFWETLALPKYFRIKEASAGMKRDEKKGRKENYSHWMDAGIWSTYGTKDIK